METGYSNKPSGETGVQQPGNETESEKQKQDRELQEQRVWESKEKWFGFSTGFLFPFVYSLALGKTFNTMTFRLPDNAALLARLGGTFFGGGTTVNAIYTSMVHSSVVKKEKRSILRHVLDNEWSVFSPAARSLIGPLACILAKDHFGIPLLTSVLFSVYDVFNKDGNTRISWSHQAGIVAGLLAGRVCNHGIKFAGRLLAHSMRANTAV